MWLWLVVSLIILAASIIFAVRIFATSYSFMTPRQSEKAITQQPVKVLFSIFRQESAVNELKAKIKTIEENYLAQFNKLQQRLDFLDHEKIAKENKWKEDDEEGGWEELYYKMLKDKEEAEEALDDSNQRRQELILRLKDSESKENAWKEMLAQLEGQQIEAQVFKNRINLLEREAEGALERQSMLEEELAVVQKLKRDHELLQHLYAHLLTEADELKLRIHEITKRDISLTLKINRLSELESNFENSEFEKTNLRKTVDEIIAENGALSAKLQELQNKLAAEKYP